MSEDHTETEAPRSAAERFIRALQAAERSGDPDQLLDAFTGDAELDSIALGSPIHGGDDVRRFWASYLGLFREIRSSFTRVTPGEDSAVLEWISEGSLRNGGPITYRGVSLLEFDGGRVRRFCTYYDSAAFTPQPIAAAE